MKCYAGFYISNGPINQHKFFTGNHWYQLYIYLLLIRYSFNFWYNDQLMCLPFTVYMSVFLWIMFVQGMIIYHTNIHHQLFLLFWGLSLIRILSNNNYLVTAKLPLRGCTKAPSVVSYTNTRFPAATISCKPSGLKHRS